MSKTITILKSRFTMKGGAEKYARLLAHALHEKGHQVTVLTTGPIEEPFPFEAITTQLKSKTSVSKLWEFEAFCVAHLNSHPTEIIFGLDRNRFQTHLRAGSGVHKAYLRHRAHFEPKWKQWRHILNPLHTALLHIEKHSYEHPDLKVLFTNSNLVKEEILSYYVIDPEKIAVIHNGVEWHAWQESFDQTQEHYDPNHYHFLYVGSGFARKGLALLLKGMSRLPHKDIHLSIVGVDKEEKSFKSLARQLGLQNKVTFHGAQQDIRPFLQQADCLVIPSYYDPFANVTVEALAMGLFVVSSKTNGGCEVLTSQTGSIIEDLDHGMEDALLAALNHPKTPEHAKIVRASVQSLDVSTQLDAYLEKMQCL